MSMREACRLDCIFPEYIYKLQARLGLREAIGCECCRNFGNENACTFTIEIRHKLVLSGFLHLSVFNTLIKRLKLK